MSSVKPWQIVVMVIAVVAVAASAYLSFSGGDQVKFASEITMVDVTTGDLFSFPVGRRSAVFPPETNPETGKRALLTANKDESGRWVVSLRELSLLSRVEGDPKALVDKKTGEVKVNNEKPKPGR